MSTWRTRVAGSPRGVAHPVVPGPVHVALFRLLGEQGAHVVDVLGGERAAAGLGLHQQRRDDVADLGQAALQVGQEAVQHGVGRGVKLDGVQGGHQPAQGVVDLVGDAGGQAAQGGQAVGFHHALFQGGLFRHLRVHAVVGQEQATQLVAIGIVVAGRNLRIELAQFVHALRKALDRDGHAPAPVPVDGQQHGQYQPGDEQGAPGQLPEAWPVEARRVHQHQVADVDIIRDHGQGEQDDPLVFR
jgi:hypothetical protein